MWNRMLKAWRLLNPTLIAIEPWNFCKLESAPYGILLSSFRERIALLVKEFLKV